MNQTNPAAATVILITGHPATGKTTLAHLLAQELHLPLIWKDQIKETLLETLGWPTRAWSRQLGVVAWTLLYQQVENLLRANVSHIVESNFDPHYADARWQALAQQYAFSLIQVRCETDAGTLLERYCRRIEAGTRHPGHFDASLDDAFLASIQRPMPWLALDSAKISVDTTKVGETDYHRVADTIRQLCADRLAGVSMSGMQ